MKLHYKLLFLLTLPVLLYGCAQPEMVYQQPAPVYRPKKVPLAKQKQAPKPKPKVETFKLPAEPLVGEEIAPSDTIAPLPTVPNAATGGESAPTSTPAPEPTPAPAPAPVPPTVESADRAGFSAPPVAVTGSPAVLALLGDAERNSRSGDLDAAAATIERALRIDSRNAGLLYKLAQIRLKQNQPRLAEDLAKKSQLYAGNNRELKKNSWMLIATARYMQGDKQGASEARERANQY